MIAGCVAALKDNYPHIKILVSLFFVTSIKAGCFNHTVIIVSKKYYLKGNKVTKF